jgi:electron transfer flavoprotein alpha subunit
MSKILIVAEHDGARLNAATAKCVTCARAVAGAEIDVVVLAADSAAVAAQAARLAGVSRVLRVDHPANAQPVAAVLAPQVAALAAGYTHVFGPSTTFGKDLMPRVSGLLGAPQLSDVMAVESATRFRRPMYAGNAIVTVEVDAGTQTVATVRVASFEAAASGDAAAPVEARTLQVELPTHTRFVSVSAARTDRTCRPRRASSPAAARWAAPTTSRSSTGSPTGSVLRWAPRGPRSMRATPRTTCRSARRARSSPPSCTSLSESRARSSI